MSPPVFKVNKVSLSAAQSLQPVLEINKPPSSPLPPIPLNIPSKFDKTLGDSVNQFPPIPPIIVKENIPSKFDKIPGDSVNQFPPPNNLVDLKDAGLTADFRPDILMLSKFNPLYDINGYDTDQKNLFDFHVEMLRQVDSSTNIALESIDKKIIKEQNTKAIDEIKKLKNNLGIIADYIKFLNFAKVYSDFSSPIYTFNTLQFIQQNFNGTNVTKKVLLESSKSSEQQENLIKSTLFAIKGNYDKVLDAYAKNPTKTWLTAITELRNLIKYNSGYYLLKDPPPPAEGEVEQLFIDLASEGDDNAGLDEFIYNTDKRISFERISKSPIQTTIGASFKELDTLKSQISDYKNVNIGLLTYVISKHFTHKSLLGDSFVNDLDTSLDNLFGIVPISTSYFNLEKEFTGDKLTDISHMQSVEQPDVTIATFESPNPEVFDDPTLSSGHEYFFNITSPDSLNFVPIQRIEKLKKTIDKTTNLFFDFMEGGALLPSVSDIKLQNTPQGFISAFNPLILLNNLYDVFLDADGNYRPYTEKEKFVASADITVAAILYFASLKIDGGDNSIIYQLKTLIYNTLFQISQTGLNSDESGFSKIFNDLLRGIINKNLDFAEANKFNETKTKGFASATNYNFDINSMKGNDIFSVDKSSIVQKIIAIFQLFTSAGLSSLCPCIFSMLLDINYATAPFKSVGLSYVAPKPGKKAAWNSAAADTPPQAEQWLFHFSFLEKTTVTAKKYGYVQKVKDNALTFKAASVTIVKNELMIFQRLSFSVLNTLKVLKSSIDLIYQKTLQFNDEVVAYILNYLNGNLKKLGLFLNEQQLLVVLSYVEDLYQESEKFVSSGLMDKQFFLKKFDSLSHSKNVVDIIKKFFKDPEYNSNLGYDKQIISVGIPHGLFKSLNLQSSNDLDNPVFNKQYDLFKILIYKMNLLEEDLIYKPKSFLFEASRFPVRVDSMLLSDYANDVNLQSTNIPPGLFLATRNYVLFGQDFTGESRVSYWNDTGNFLGTEYGDLTDLEKLEILNNHASSFLLENYIKIISGLKINDISCTINSTKELNELYSKFVDNPTIKNLVSKQSSLYQPINSGLSDITSVLKRIITPKKYDRVYNIIFDPQFEVDLDATQKLNFNNPLYILKLQEKGIIELVGSFPEIKWMDTNKSAMDTVVNAYFVVVESYSSKKNKEI